MMTSLKRGTGNRGIQGFTLIELLIVIAVIGILMGMLSTALVKSKEKAKRTQANVEVKTLASAIRNYRHEYGRWPFDHAEIDGDNKYECQDDCRSVISYMRDENTGKNPRKIQFANWNEYFTLNDEDERVPLDAYMEDHSSDPIPIVGPYGNKIKIVFDLDKDRATVSNGPQDITQDA